MTDSPEEKENEKERQKEEIAEASAGLRRLLLVILLLGMAGMTVELLFLDHDEAATQLIPLILLGMGIAVTVWHAVQKGAASLMALQLVMVLFVATGLLGMYLHFVASIEFLREMDPSIGGRALFWKALMEKTPPALAPGSMSQLGLIGLAYSYRHPGFRRPSPRAAARRDDTSRCVDSPTDEASGSDEVSGSDDVMM
jgi:hypothetical protein